MRLIETPDHKVNNRWLSRFIPAVLFLLPLFIAASCHERKQPQQENPFYSQKVTEPVKPLLNRAFEVQDSNAVAALPYYEKALELAKSTGDKPAQAKIYRNLVFINSVHRNDFETALAISDSSIAFAMQLNDANTLCNMYGVRSVVYQVAGKTNEAVKASTMALQYMEKDTAPDSLKNYPLYINVARLYIDLGNYHLADENAKKFLLHYTGKKDTTRMILGHQTLSASAYQNNDSSAFYLHTLKAWELLQTQKNNQYTDQVYSSLVAMHKSRSRYDSARYFADKRMEYLAPQKSPDYYINLIQMTEIAYEATDAGYAKEILKYGVPLDEAANLPLSHRKNLYDGYYKILKMTGNPTMANVFLEKAYSLAAELRTQEINKDLEKYELERKKAMQENLLLNKELQLNRKNNTISVMTVSALLLIVAGAAIFVGYKRKLQLQKGHIELLEKKKEWESAKASLEGQLNERNRISQELHDELGTTLTSITLAAEILKSEQADERSEVNIIADRASEMAGKMNEIVWSLNAENDNLQSLVSYIRKFSSGFLNEAGLKLQFEESLREPFKEVKGNVRRDIYLTAKEAVHNIVKHSGATWIGMEITESEALSIVIKDNGKGIDEQLIYAGNGMKNMRRRIENLGGKIEWKNENGTVVNLKVPV